MWNFLAREAAKRIGGSVAANKIVGVDEANGPEVYADRIKRDFHLHDYAVAWALYDSDRAYWENYYRPRPNVPAWNAEMVRDSAAAAGVPSRNNVFEYGFPQANSEQSSIVPAPSPQMSVFATGAPAISFSPAAPENGSRGLPALLAETGAFDPSNPEWPPIGGLPGLIREYLRNN